MKIKSKYKKILIILVVIVPLFCTFLYSQNNSITTTEITIQNDNIPDTFEGYKILQISDFHNKQFGQDQKNILSKIEEINPDIIVITGDLIDSYITKVDVAMELISGAIKIAPIYYVSGNHEARVGFYDELKSELEDYGVIVLDNEKVEISKDNEFIEIIGLSDKSFNETTKLNYEKNTNTESILNTLVKDNNIFKILLSHRPEMFETYTNSDVDLIFSGHAHGGQFRIPFIGGLIAPDQGLFPKLTEGIHIRNNRSMIVSRGLGNSLFPQRLFNKPELIVVTLSK